MDEPIDHAAEARRELLGAEVTRSQWFRTWQDGDDAQAAHLAQTVQHCLAAAQVHATLALVTVAAAAAVLDHADDVALEDVRTWGQ